MSYTQVMIECIGYLKALNDMELLTEDFGEALNSMTDRVIKEQASGLTILR